METTFTLGMMLFTQASRGLLANNQATIAQLRGSLRVKLKLRNKFLKQQMSLQSIKSRTLINVENSGMGFSVVARFRGKLVLDTAVVTTGYLPGHVWK